MHTIKHRNGKVLYVASDASDVKTALVQAVRSGADLSGADLGEADLNGADLNGADLGGSDLSWAYMRGSYLRGADLSGADLRGADLSGADLGEADLSGADLGGADLFGAYLREAYLSESIWAEVAKNLDCAVAIMNDGGRHWVKGTMLRVLEDGSNAYCSLGGIEAACNDETVRAVSTWLVQSVSGGGLIIDFNDYAGTTWKDVQAVFSLAAKHARRFADEQS